MADSILIALNRDLILGPLEWNKILKANDIDIIISEDLNPISHSGFIRCLFEGKQTGFEYQLEEIDLSEYKGELKRLVSSSDSIVSLTMRDGIKSALAASAIAAAIALTATSSVIDVDETIIDGNDAIDWVRGSIDSFKEFQVEAAKAKKEARRLKNSQRLTRERLEQQISMLLGYSPIEGFTAGAYLGLKFKKDSTQSSLSMSAWEFGSNEGLIKRSSDLLQDEPNEVSGCYFADEEKCEDFYPQLGKALDDCEIVEATLNSTNEIYIRFSNGFYMRSMPIDELTFSAQYLNFRISPDEIRVDA